jgi:GNAT superfamily N-acetyltransferase
VSSDVRVIAADLENPEHARAIVDLTAAYADDVMGNGGPLRAGVLERLVPALREHPTTIVFLAYLDAAPVGIATCFLGFSTFAARPLINVHDLAVLPGHRGRGIGRALLAAVETHARQRGCVKLTLEAHEKNHRARRVYERAGFTNVVYGEATGGSLFYAKAL